ncbi:MAG: RagB/SusD family nutrient uptake outer membrane protein [Mucilaginibacter sp.]|nr:RagB/SusD family nutrient uptake outer membrane protein [Mucilaginibacter sp.]
MSKQYYIRSLFFTISCIVCSGCNKLVQVPEPVNTITTSETFSTPANATSALINVYSLLSYDQDFLTFSNGAVTLEAGLSADELNYFKTSAEVLQFQNNALQSNNSYFYNRFWSLSYQEIYGANAVIEGIQSSKTLPTSVKNQLTGEAKFLRAFCYFYLSNLFGDVPLVTTTAYAKTVLLSRTATSLVYQQMISDLKDAQSLLPDDYKISNGERIRANKSAATALLARVYLYNKNYPNAASSASDLIANTGVYALSPLSQVFSANSSEAILQWQVSNTLYPYATVEGNSIIPSNNTNSPIYYCSTGLLNAFESGDQRKTTWISNTVYSGTTYYYPFKYTVRQGSSGDAIPQYYMVLRLAEQYLIRAEAEANGAAGGDEAAIADLNIIRNRANLPPLSVSLTHTQVIAAIAQERRVELFSEWGHRWLDLKRTGQALTVLSQLSYKTALNANQLLYPIPLHEIQDDPNLTQNPGY